MKQYLFGIARALAEGRCTLFLGSGLSKEAGVLDAAGLRDLLANGLTEAGDKLRDLQSVAQDYSVVHTDVTLKLAIKASLEESLESTSLILTTHNLLPDLGHCNIITTNWDGLIERVFPVTRLHVIFSEGDVRYWSLKKQNLLKMHGCLSSPSTIVVTRREYEAYRTEHPEISRKIQSLILDSTLVICGYSLEDLTFRELFREVHSRQRSLPHHIYWVEPYQREAYIEGWRDLGVKHIPLAAADFFRSLKSLSTRDPVGDHASNSELKALARQAIEIEKSFDALDDVPLEDFTVIRERFASLHMLFERYKNAVRSGLPTMSLAAAEEALTLTTRLRDLPERIESSLRRNQERLHFQSPDAASILLRNLVIDFQVPFIKAIEEISLRVDHLKGKPFAVVTLSSRASDLGEVVRLIRELDGASGLRRHALIRELFQVKRLDLASLMTSPGAGELKEAALGAIWRSFDVLLLSEYSSAAEERFLLLRAAIENGGLRFVDKMRFVLVLFGRERSAVLSSSLDKLKRQLEPLEGKDRIIILRCLRLPPVQLCHSRVCGSGAGPRVAMGTGVL